MSSELSQLQFWTKRIPVLLVVCAMAYCSSSSYKKMQAAPLRSELYTLFQKNGMLDRANPNRSLTDVAKRVGEPGMNTLLYDAAPTATLDALKWLVDNGANPKDVSESDNFTLLQQVALRPTIERMQYFLNAGLDPLERSRDGRTVLHVAAQGGLDHEVLALLLSKGLKVTDADLSGRLPLHYAAVNSIGVLLAAGAQIDAKDTRGMTALHVAAKEGRKSIVTELLKHSASVFVVDNQGMTPLHYAAMMSNADEVIDALLAAGAPTGARDNEGRTPKDLALEGRGNSFTDKTIDKL